MHTYTKSLKTCFIVLVDFHRRYFGCLEGLPTFGLCDQFSILLSRPEVGDSCLSCCQDNCFFHIGCVGEGLPYIGTMDRHKVSIGYPRLRVFRRVSYFSFSACHLTDRRLKGGWISNIKYTHALPKTIPNHQPRGYLTFPD